MNRQQRSLRVHSRRHALGPLAVVAVLCGSATGGCAGSPVGSSAEHDGGIERDGGAALDAGATDSGPIPSDASRAPADGPAVSDASHDAGAGASTFVPYFADGFESYSDGERLSGGPFGAAGRTTASSERAHRGGSAARMAIREGDGGGFGQWGGTVRIEPRLRRGQEVWVRLYVNWPATFEFSATPFMKFIRLHNRTGDGMNGGYNDLYVDDADGPTSVLRTIKEVHDRWAIYDGAPIARDTWERYEMYLFIDHVSVDDGGEGRVRIWRDDELIFDRTDVPTITEAEGTIDYLYLFTYWNNEMPPDNHVFVDDLVIATSESPPPERDAHGHPFIGAWIP